MSACGQLCYYLLMQYDVWEKEYKSLTLLTGKPEPQKDVTRFLKWLKKNQGIKLEGLKVLDLGSGTGRNTNFLQSLGNDCTGLEISDTALSMARSRAREEKLDTQFIKHDIGTAYPFAGNAFDLLLDVTSSNSLNDEERSIYLSESHRVLKTGGHFFVKALCREGDKNAQNLIKRSPGPDHDTYIMPEIGLTERVFSREDFNALYGRYFKVLKLERKTSYTQFNNRAYKRNFWIAYLQKN